MAIACEVRRVLSKKPNKIKLADFKLAFQHKDDDQPHALTPEQETNISKQHWLLRFGHLGKPPSQ